MISNKKKLELRALRKLRKQKKKNLKSIREISFMIDSIFYK
jgi:hypothetical protein